jgi:glycosyltransferase involved in cell wall biosynthesis
MNGNPVRVDRDLPLRILALNWRCHRHPQAGGSEANLFEQAARWVSAGHHVTVFTSDPGREHAPERDERYLGIDIRRRGGRGSVYLRAALYMLRHRRFDRVLDVANGVPFFAPLFTRRPVVLLVHHVHGHQWRLEFPWAVAKIGDAIERRLVPRIYRRGPVIAVSETTRDALVTCGFAPSVIRVVHNGVSTPLPTDGHVREPNRLVYVGRLRPYKRLERLVAATASLREQFPQVRLDIVGEGDARAGLEHLVQSLGLESSVEVHGYVDDDAKAAFLARAGVFVSPSMHEGWGLSVIEANSYGCPAVAYPVPGLSEAIRPGETGLLAADEDLTTPLRTLLADPVLWQHCSDGARLWASQFSWDRCASRGLSVVAQAGRLRVVDGPS